MLATLPKAVTLYRDQIDAGLACYRRVAARLASSGENFSAEQDRAPTTVRQRLVTAWHLQPAALLKGVVAGA